MSSKIQKNQILKKTSYAKINLFLKILSKRQDGFHNILSLFQKIDLCDYLYFKPSSKLEVQCNVDLGISDSENIVYKSAVALNEFTNQNNTVRIEIEKNIPTQAGLGGGSSNAATTLLTLNELWNLNLEFDDLLRIAMELGSDVPFFIHDAPYAMVAGKGNIVLPLENSDDFYYLLVCPKVNVSTANAYSLLCKEYDEKYAELETFASTGDIANRIYCLDLLKNIFTEVAFAARDNGINIFLQNDFEEVIFRLHPELLLLKKELMLLSDDVVIMTGSGSAFFAIFDNLSEAQNAQKKLQGNLEYQSFIVKQA